MSETPEEMLARVRGMAFVIPLDKAATEYLVSELTRIRSVVNVVALDNEPSLAAKVEKAIRVAAERDALEAELMRIQLSHVEDIRKLGEHIDKLSREASEARANLAEAREALGALVLDWASSRADGLPDDTPVTLTMLARELKRARAVLAKERT